MKVIDGNHHVAALKASGKEAGRPRSMVMVRVHDPMEVSMMKMVAEGKLVTMFLLLRILMCTVCTT